MNNDMNSPLGLIFDIDGVLVDSNPAHFESWVVAAQEDGFEFTPELFQQTFGQTSRAIIKNHWPRDVSPEEIARIDKRKEDLYREYVPTKVKLIPGAKELLLQLESYGFAVAVGSSGPGINVNFIVDFFELRSHLKSIVSGTDVVNGKPWPDIFLKAAQEMNVRPSRCAIIDDSESGILSGVAAGMKTIGFFSEGHLPYEYAKADMLVHSFAELSPELIARFIAESCNYKK